MRLANSKFVLASLLVLLAVAGVVIVNSLQSRVVATDEADVSIRRSGEEPTIDLARRSITDGYANGENGFGIPPDRDISIVGDNNVDAEQTVKDVAKEFYVNADRATFVKVDSERFLSNLRFTQAFMYAESGNYPAEVSDSGVPDLILNLFEDTAYPLSVLSVDLLDRPGRRDLVVEGKVTNIAESVFRITSTGDGSMFSGFVDTPEYFTRFDTWKISDYTAVAEFNRNTVP